ncbi:Ig-like domain-containing protein [Arenimonas composti]|uniref:Calx-beta domain-containing protein n=1 Tax=Arenimonas composti TR7-09 = DSM 18010 TaxID=1121013 RepID=A0A091BG46_9GAMM|nr:Ig-like domain-containing protein [Arenimonas composti]KFN49779.1 hypothetical protein P873_09495 [Arenimonas composti TR7-09 = DSM 18010]
MGELMRAAIALLAAALVVTPAKAQDQAPPTFSFKEFVRVDEGDSGLTEVVVEWRLLWAPPGYSTGFTIHTEDLDPPQARAGVDYVPLPPTRIDVAAGQTSGTLTLQLIGDTEVESNEIFWLHYRDFANGARGPGGGSQYTTGIHIANDDQVPLPPLTGNDDHVWFDVNSPGVLIEAHLNDIEIPAGATLRDTVMTLLSQPRHGTVEKTAAQYPRGTERFIYRPGADFAGNDGFDYRLCKADGQCVEARVHVQGRVTAPRTGVGRISGIDVEVDNLRALDDARYLVSTLAPGRIVELPTTVDATPHTTWDGFAGMAWKVYTIPARTDGNVAEYRVHVVSENPHEARIDMLVGIDSDGDGRPSAAEQRCFAGYAYATGVSPLTCEMTIEVGGAPVTYWIAGHSREATATTARMRVHEARMDAQDGGMVVTGPTLSDDLDTLPLQIAWRDTTNIEGSRRVAFVRVVDAAGVAGDFRVDLWGGTFLHFLLLPLDGSPLVVDMAPTFFLERAIFFDVPSGAERLTITARSDRPVDIAPTWYGGISQTEPRIPEGSVPSGESAWIRIGEQPRTITVEKPRWQRWHLLIRNGGDTAARIELTATLAAVPPTVRPGSYYNPRQSGSGLILYPSGEQWAGLWYTYLRDGRPTWYYLQAPQPGANGLWRSQVYRAAWNGSVARHAPVGEAVLTPLDPDRFALSFVIDGFAGSQVMEALGRGCPAVGGQVVDISAHWFDPARAGTGYSVQMWEDYEFFAAFNYDRQGFPVFLAAESPDFAGAGVADLDLQILRGAAPYYDYFAPSRAPAGILQRRIDGGRLTEVQMLVDYEELPPFTGRRTWSIADRVQPLGASQGCEP